MMRKYFEPWHLVLFVFSMFFFGWITWDGLTCNRPRYHEMELQRDAYRDSLAIARHQKDLLIQQLDTLRKIKIDEIRSVDSTHVDSLLLFIANFPTAQR